MRLFFSKMSPATCSFVGPYESIRAILYLLLKLLIIERRKLLRSILLCLIVYMVSCYLKILFDVIIYTTLNL
jgi:hypothetical protein